MPKECPFIKGFCKRESCQLWIPQVEECAFKVIPSRACWQGCSLTELF